MSKRLRDWLIMLPLIAIISLVLGMALPLHAESADVTCNKVSQSFMSKNKAYTLPMQIDSIKSDNIVTCIVQFEEDNIDYSSPAILQFTLNLYTKNYKIRNIGGF